MTSLLNNKQLSKSEMAVAVEMELHQKLEKVRNQISKEQGNENPTSYTPIRLASLRGEEKALVQVLDFMIRNMKRGGK